MLAGMGGAVASTAVTAADWSATTDVQFAAQGERNPALRPDGNPLGLALSTELKANLARKTETSELEVSPIVDILRNPHNSSLDRDDDRLAAHYSKTGERVDFTVTGDASQESTLTSELGTTGRTDLNEVRQVLDAGLAPQWRLTERLSAAASVNRQATSYSASANNVFFGSRYTTATGSVNLSESDQLALSLAASDGRFNSDRVGASSGDHDITAQLRYSLGERLTASASVGPSWVSANGRTQQGYVYKAALQEAFELGSLSLSAGRAQSPSGYGVLTQRDDVTLAYSHQLSETLSASLGMTGIRTADLIPAAGLSLDTVTYMRFDTNLTKRLTPAWSTTFGLAAARQRISLGNQATNSFQVRAAINWSGEFHAH